MTIAKSLANIGCLWLNVAAFGYLWLYVVVFGCLWLYMAVFISLPSSLHKVEELVENGEGNQIHFPLSTREKRKSFVLESQKRIFVRSKILRLKTKD